MFLLTFFFFKKWNFSVFYVLVINQKNWFDLTAEYYKE
jgi:hypothetical protein